MYKMRFGLRLILFSSFLQLLACGTDANSSPGSEAVITNKVLPEKEKPQAMVLPQNTSNQYIWLEKYNIENSLLYRIPVPDGFKRTAEAEGSFADWLRYLPLQKAGSQVHLYNGELKANQTAQAAVIKIDVGKRDLQQCADAVMRLKAEYHFSRKDYQSIHFNFTSGHKVSFEDWRKGRKPKVQGNAVDFTPKTGHLDNSYSNFKSYLQRIFMYAGTASLEKEMVPKSTNEIKIGDVFIQGGFPGHAVLVVDMAENDKGKKVFLLAQSYMPAQEIHVLKNPMNSELSPWYREDFGEVLSTPEWEFAKSNLRSFSSD